MSDIEQRIDAALRDDTSWCDDFGESTISEMTRRVARICAREFPTPPVYPTNDEVEEFFKHTVAPPALKQLRKVAEADGAPLRKIIGNLMEQLAADSMIAEAIAAGKLTPR